MDNPWFPPNSFRSGDASRERADPSLPASFCLGDWPRFRGSRSSHFQQTTWLLVLEPRKHHDASYYE
jgi:hypothetical protein